MASAAANTSAAVSRPLRTGDRIPVASVRASSEASPNARAENLIAETGSPTCWVADERDGFVWVEFDLGATYPIGEMRVRNYRQSLPGFPDLWKRGLRRITVEHSLDGERWIELAGEGAPYELVPANGSSAGAGETSIRWGDQLARYVRIAADLRADGFWGGYDANDRFGGLSEVRFYAGTGWAAEPAEAWNALFRRASGWTGSDGIYSIPLDGRDSHGDGSSGRTLLLFGDTFVGEVDPATGRRLTMTMINNSMALLDGAEPDVDRLRFLWNDADPAVPDSAIVPATPKAATVDGAYYWLQDGACVGGSFYCFPMIVGPNPDGPEGFQFQVHGVTICRAPMTPEGPDFGAMEQFDTPLYGATAAGHRAYYGAAVMPHTVESNVPDPDGYVYVYGLLYDRLHRAVVARALPEQLFDGARWTFWNGSDWSLDPAQAAPVSSETSPEYSVSPLRGGSQHGRYALAYMRSDEPRAVAIQLGDSPVGPFEGEIALYACPEAKEGGGRYVYNAKAHPSLSKPGELLISYNVNSTSMDDHVRYGDIYRPRFVNVRRIE
ncbi:DUF4185 domain-containing protein [Paenibacillus antri]|nr:DUF4185 domain-containing protein [Paenibacillus antri]